MALHLKASINRGEIELDVSDTHGPRLTSLSYSVNLAC